jgi:hypothetical protein
VPGGEGGGHRGRELEGQSGLRLRVAPSTRAAAGRRRVRDGPLAGPQRADGCRALEDRGERRVQRGNGLSCTVPRGLFDVDLGFEDGGGKRVQGIARVVGCVVRQPGGVKAFLDGQGGAVQVAEGPSVRAAA